MQREPLPTDRAMQQRNWPVTISRYENGSVVTGPTGFAFQSNENLADWQYPFVETPLFVGQVALLPVTLVLAPPWTSENFSGVVMGPTFTAAPPIPRPSKPDP